MNYNETEQTAMTAKATGCIYIARQNIFLPINLLCIKKEIMLLIVIQYHNGNRLAINEYPYRHKLLLCRWCTVSTYWSNLKSEFNETLPYFQYYILHTVWHHCVPLVTLFNQLHEYQPHWTPPFYPTVIHKCNVNKLQ